MELKAQSLEPQNRAPASELKQLDPVSGVYHDHDHYPYRYHQYHDYCWPQRKLVMRLYLLLAWLGLIDGDPVPGTLYLEQLSAVLVLLLIL